MDLQAFLELCQRSTSCISGFGLFTYSLCAHENTLCPNPFHCSWAFGILMWEVVTLGGTPYAEIKPREIYPHLLDGMRLQRPQHCAQPVYDMMSQCWSFEPTARPFFSDIYNALNNLNLSKMVSFQLKTNSYQHIGINLSLFFSPIPSTELPGFKKLQ